MNPFEELQRREDPYRNYPDLNCHLVKAKHNALVVVNSSRIIGHVAITRHVVGTFGVLTETISAVGLGTAVSVKE